MQTHAHSPVFFADAGWAERSIGGRKSVGTLVAAHQDAGLPPTQIVNGNTDEKDILFLTSSTGPKYMRLSIEYF